MSDDSAGYDYDGGDEGSGVASADDAGSASQGGTSGNDGDDGVEDDDGDIPGTESGDDGSDDGTTGAVACDDAEPVTLFLSPDDSNSMSSPVQVRASVSSEWGSLGYAALRPWEFFNYYRFDYPPAPAGTLGVHPSLFVDDGAEPGEYVLQIGVASEAMTLESRPPMNITFVLDTSGSMEGQPLELLQASCRTVARNLREGDVVSMVTWNSTNSVVLSNLQVDGPDDPALLSAIDGVSADGSTDLHGGLVAGYGLAEAAHRPGVISRVLLISDGGANAGVTDVEIIAKYAGGHDEDGIYLVGVGVGTPETYNDELMDDVTDVGKGASVFIPDADEAELVFGERFVSTMGVAARDVQVRLDLPPGFEIVRFSGEEFSADPSEIEPQHLAPDDTMVFHQRIRTCAPELVDGSTPITVTVRYKDATTFEMREIEHASTFAALLDTDPALLLEGAAVFEYATALQAMRDGNGTSVALAPAISALERARAVAPDDEDLAEIAAVLAALQ